MPAVRRRRQTAVEEDARPQRRQNIENSDDDRDEESDEAMDENVLAAQSADNRLAKKMIRYALSCEYSRTPIRRDGIKERVLGKQGRAFKKIFALAQTQLRTIWGMEFRELPVREKMTLHEKRQAMKSNSQPKTGSGAYILSSTLPAAFRDASILRPSKVPTVEDEAIYTGFYTMVISLIWLNGGELSEQRLQRYLLRLNADRNVASERTEVTLKKLERHGYLIKRIDRPPIGHDGEKTVTWHVGPRAKEEVGLDGVMGLVREVYGYPEDEDFEKKLWSSLGIKNRQNAQEEDADGDRTMTNGR